MTSDLLLAVHICGSPPWYGLVEILVCQFWHCEGHLVSPEKYIVHREFLLVISLE